MLITDPVQDRHQVGDVAVASDVRAVDVVGNDAELLGQRRGGRKQSGSEHAGCGLTTNHSSGPLSHSASARTATTIGAANPPSPIVGILPWPAASCRGHLESLIRA